MKNFQLISLCLLFLFQLAFASYATNSFVEQAQELLRTNDLNKDGKLSPDEVDWRYRIRRFKTVDSNADGYLDQTELTTSFKNAELARQQRIQNGDEDKNPLQKFVDKELLTSKPDLADSGRRYTVKAGDSIYSISRRYGVTQSNLRKVNNLMDEGKLPIGKVLLIPNN